MFIRLLKNIKPLTRCTYIAIRNGKITPHLTKLEHIQMKSITTQRNQKSFNRNKIPLYNSSDFSTKLIQDQKLKGIDEYINKLKAEQISRGSVNYDLCLKAVNNLDESTSEEQIFFLFQCCINYFPAQTNEERLDIFNKVWNFVNKNAQITQRHYLIALRFFQTTNVPLEDLENFIQVCKETNDTQVYEHLLWLFCDRGNTVLIKDILEDMKSKKFPLNENIFNAQILGCSRVKDLKGVTDVLEAMNAAGIESTTETYCELIKAFIENGDIEKAEKTLLEHGQNFNTIQILKVLKNATISGTIPLVKHAIKLLPSDMLKVVEIPPAISNICTELIFSGLSEKAFLIVEAYPTPTFSENQDKDTFGVSFIIDLIKSEEDSDKVIDYCKYLIDSNKNSRALHTACEFSLRYNSRNASNYLEALSKMEPLRPHYFWPLFLKNFQINGEVGVLNTLKLMRYLKTECNNETLSAYVFPRLSIVLEDEKNAIKTLEDCNLKTTEFLTPLISHLLLQQRIDGAVSIMEEYQSKLQTENFIYPIINLAIILRVKNKYRKLAKVINAIDKKSRNVNYDFVGQLLMEVIAHPKMKYDIETLKELISELRKQNLRISSLACDSVSSHLNKLERNTEIVAIKSILKEMVNSNLSVPSGGGSDSIESVNITHPRDMNLEELECHLAELEAKKLNTRGVLRRLLQLCVREGKLERALEIKKKCDQLRVYVSPGMLASIFDMYTKLRRLNEAEQCYKQIKGQFPDFRLDEHKLIDFATLLMENNRLDDIKNLLIERAANNKITGGEHIVKNIWQLLTKCATISANSSSNGPNPNQSKELFLLLEELKYCRPDNVLLGPIIREFLLRNQIKEAVAEYKEITEKYKKTPLQFELMSLLVSLSNADKTENGQITPDEARELLQQVIAASASVHGAANTNSNLVLAVANSGTEIQLRKILINPEIRINSEVLIKNCEHLSTSGRIEVLLRLAKAGRNMGHAVKEQDLYNILLNNFVSENNCTAALELFEKLESDDDFKISQDFLKTLINLFKMNNFEIPTNLAIRAHNLL